VVWVLAVPSRWQAGERAFKPSGLANAPSLTVGFRPAAGPPFAGAMHSPHTTYGAAYSGDPHIRTSPVHARWAAQENGR
jgi:hypothetical protein